MTSVFCRAVSLCFFALAGVAFAQVDAAVAEGVLGKSGTLAQVDAVTPQFRGNFEQGLREQRDVPLTRDETTKLTAVGDRTFAATTLRTSIVATVASRLTPEQARALEAWYDSESGKRMLALEAQAAKADPAKALQEGAAIAAKLTASQSSRLSALIEATRAAEFIADLSIDMAVAATYATSVATSPRPTPSFTEIAESASKERAQVAQSMKTLLLNAYAKTYENASDDELKAYAEFMNTSAGKQFTETIIVAFNRAIAASANELGRSLVDSKKPSKR